MSDRGYILDGRTYRIKMPEGNDLLVTINDKDGQPFEIFVESNDPAIYQWVGLATVLITRLIRDGHSLDQIAEEMQEIHCPYTGHIIPGTNQKAPSMIARIGRTIKQHMENKDENSRT